ncbi:type II toxin-antitoxin system VapC family toxin [Brachybacterium squillarum]|uniref:type II toxin-antitoxin system VapC family toxin n=1 Tax=Brachybacterium squillarum TaxID=661979 RepID=UPI00026298C4|nr:type II toxin-antitoxin system VapC family toxin [Brachybacterium squillarum]
MLYVDSSALLTRVFSEAESPDVREVLVEHHAAGELIAASELAWLEVARALRRAEVEDVDRYVDLACSGVARHSLDSAVLTRARRVGPAQIRSLDAIHLAAAVALGAEEILTYDDRLAGAAQSLGMRPIP